MKDRFMDNKKNHKFSIIPKYSENPYPSGPEFENDRGDIVYYGTDNKFPSLLIELYHRSSVHSTAINSKHQAVVGQGLTGLDEDILKVANKEGETWNDIFNKVALDRVLYGGFALEAIWSNDRTKIAEIYHVDFSYVRAKKMDMRGCVPGYYVWRDFGKMRGYIPNKSDIPYLPTFSRRDRTEPSQLIYFKPYTSGLDYYPLPDYMGSLKTIELDTEVDNFHTNNLKNGLAPSLAITTFTDADVEEREEIERALRGAYSGTDNAGSLMYMDVANRDQMPEIVPIPQNGADGYYTTVNEMVTQKILTGHRITSPMLVGIKTAGQLGGKDELLDAYSHYLTTVIYPMQSDILKTFEGIFRVNGIDTTLGVEQTKLFDDGEEEIDIVTSVESEAGEDKILETKAEGKV
jgi:hypothetical protein